MAKHTDSVIRNRALILGGACFFILSTDTAHLTGFLRCTQFLYAILQ